MVVFSYNELKIDRKNDGCYNQKCYNTYTTSKTSFQHIHVHAILFGLADDVLVYKLFTLPTV